jgi:hypothetical protein
MLCGPTADPEPENYSVCYHRQGSIPYYFFTIILFSAQDISCCFILDFSSNLIRLIYILWFMVLDYD